jgi:peptidoglycan/LPS O-acetylase OafA/YrhL
VEFHDTLGTVTPKPFPFAAYSPLGVTALLVLWTMLVSPHSKYGDSWAIGPALFALPLVVGLHVLLAYKAQRRNSFVAYGLVHCALFFVIWIYCLMAISKDSL